MPIQTRNLTGDPFDYSQEFNCLTIEFTGRKGGGGALVLVADFHNPP